MMKFAVAALFLASVTFASSKTYEILLPQPTQAGSVLLVPGQYRVTVDGTDVVFQNVRSTQSFRTAVKVEDTGAAYDVTRVSTSKNAGTQRMDAIEFEGSGTKIEF